MGRSSRDAPRAGAALAAKNQDVHVRGVREPRLLALAAVLVAVLLSVPACSPPNELGADANRQAFSVRDAELAAERVRQRVSAGLLANYALVVYVDKALTGPLAQNMVVFERRAGGHLAPLYVWPVSSGREDVEPDARGAQESTDTPEGVFTLDPRRMYESYVSSQWNEAMPYAMFLAGRTDVHGLAIHAATGEGIDHIGSRASAGCIRLAPENARTLFGLVRARLVGPVPELRATASASAPALQHDRKGRLKRANGYSVIVVIDDYQGEAFASLSSALH